MVNETLWGSKSTWVNYYNGVITSPSTNKENYTFAYGRNGANPPTQLPEGEKFDLSCAPWGIGGDSILCKLSYMLPIWDNNLQESEQKIFTYPVDDKAYGKPHPLILTGSRQCTVPGTVLNSDLGQHDGRIHLIDSYSPTFTPNYNPYADYSFWTQNVICNFDYSKILIVPYIMTTSGDSYSASDILSEGNYMYWTIEQLTTRWDEIEGKKAIKGVLFDVYLGSAGSRYSDGAGFQFNVPQLYPKVEIVGSQWGQNPKPMVDTTTLISNGWDTRSWGTTRSVGYLLSNSFGSMHYYNDLTDKEKSLQYWSWHGNPVSYMDDNWTIYQQNPTDSGDKVIRPIFNYEGKTAQQVVDYFLKQVALLGFPFVIDPNDVQGEIGSNNSICLPLFTNDGITTGEYVQGVDCRSVPNFAWRDNVWTKNKYDPNKDPEDDDKGDLNNYGGLNMFHTGLTTYAMSYPDLILLITRLNKLYENDPDGITNLQTQFQGSNPSDYIVGAYATVCDLEVSNDTAAIEIGPVEFEGLDVHRVVHGNNGHFDCGSVKLTPNFYDFRDFEPYTTAELYLPLCGTIKLDIPFFMGHEINVQYWYDYTTMSCTAAIYRDGTTLYKTVDGTMGAQIPLSALRMGDYQNNINMLKLNDEKLKDQLWVDTAKFLMTTVGTGVALGLAPETGGLSMLPVVGTSAAVSSTTSLISSAASIANNHSKIQYQLEHSTPGISTTGCADPQNAFSVGSMYPFLFIKRAKMLDNYDKDIYGDTVGFACCYQSHVKDESGLIVASDIKCDGLSGATLEEINMIKTDFANGVIV